MVFILVYNALYYSMAIATKREIKVDLIQEINKILTGRGKPPISPRDFDILYDMSVKELLSVKRELIKELDYYN